ncbi:MAG: 4-hydroxythreonine-4-phosphate dehydrogenase PdxA [Endozoicomonadaceae bacterium]|nr:4-hydroxythreonine-4-phosphate dehydrogenase PdxA [Endozoicomonadaceae bacterium]
MAVPTIAITTGEPAGIGPDICLQLLQTQKKWPVRIVLIGCITVLSERSKKLGLSPTFIPFDPNTAYESIADTHIEYMHVPSIAPVTPGQLDCKNAPYVLNTLTVTYQNIQNHIFKAWVTAPIHKGIINDAGIAFSGHTEWLAQASNTPQVLMMLACDNLRVALATTHIPLKQVPEHIHKNSLIDIITLLHQEMKYKFRIQNPHISVCGLNPHAGENGYLGSEEIEHIIPAIQACQKNKMHVSGPYPADTIFTKPMLLNTDVVLAMYHDQGLPVLKYQSFGHAVNITLGLPFIRTSVDHGTALSLAGTGQAHTSSLKQAVHEACHLASQSKSMI